MLGGKNKQPKQLLGYTIIEVMIVLAVSGVMFLIAANFINGKQERASFTQGSNDSVSLLQNVVEDITDGHYSDVPIQCATSGSALSFPSGVSPSQGQNPACVFLGKLAHFYGSGSNRTNYQLFSIAAARTVTSFPNSQVAAIPHLTTQSTLPQGLAVKTMHVKDSAGKNHANFYSIGFIQGLGSVDAATGVYASGAQQPVGLVYASDTNPGAWDEADVTGTTLQSARSATICLSDGSRNAEIFIGGANDNRLSISIQQLGTTPCP